ncbi:MAG: 50S ribosomal protein L14e [Candidatus Methanofastidiosia archaeon]
MVLDIGRVCIKLSGREAGRKCVVVDRIDKNYVLVTGPKELTGVRRRGCNIKHLEPTQLTLEISKSESDENIAKLIKEKGVEY